jgi:excisionase family DNA binding protein
VDDAKNAADDRAVLWTVGEVCGRLSCRRSWLYDEVEAGRFPVVRLGRLLRFRPADVEAYVEARTRVPSSAGSAAATANPTRRRRPRRRKSARSP